MISEKQSVAGQWRALTRKFTMNNRGLQDHCEKALSGLLRQATILSGMHPTADCNPEPLIRVIVSKAIKIRHRVGEAMISSDYQVVAPQARCIFDAGEMEDAYAPRGKKRRSGPHVMCCVALGLKRVEKVEGQLRSEILVKPEVGLQTLLEDLGLESAGTSGKPPNH